MDYGKIDSFAGWFATGLALYFLLPTLLIYFMQVFRAENMAQPLAPDVLLPPTVNSELSMYRRDLVQLGFESRGIILISGMVNNVTALSELYVNSASGDLALVSYIYSIVNGELGETTQYTEYVRRFRSADLVLLQTNNADRRGAFLDDPGELSFRLPSVADVRELHALHLRLLERHAAGMRPFIRVDEEFGGDRLKYLEAITRECFERQTERGWMKYDERGKCWKPTLWGAFRMVAQELPPIKQIRAMRHRALGRRHLAELGEAF